MFTRQHHCRACGLVRARSETVAKISIVHKHIFKHTYVMLCLYCSLAALSVLTRFSVTRHFAGLLLRSYIHIYICRYCHLQSLYPFKCFYMGRHQTNYGGGRAGPHIGKNVCTHVCVTPECMRIISCCVAFFASFTTAKAILRFDSKEPESVSFFVPSSLSPLAPFLFDSYLNLHMPR